jgi:hypothetical protein
MPLAWARYLMAHDDLYAIEYFERKERLVASQRRTAADLRQRGASTMRR